MKRFDTLCENILNVCRYVKVRAEMERNYKIDNFQTPNMDLYIPDQIPIQSNTGEVHEHCCWNEFMLESEDEEPIEHSDSQTKHGYKLNLPDNRAISNDNCIDPQDFTLDQYAQQDTPSDVLSDKEPEHSDYDANNVDSQSFGHHNFSDDGGPMNGADRYGYESETSENY